MSSPALDSIEFDDQRQIIKFVLNGNTYLARPTLGNEAFSIYQDLLNLMKYNKARALDFLRTHTAVAKMENVSNPFFLNLLDETGYDRDLSTSYQNPPSYPVVTAPGAAASPQSTLQGPDRPVYEEDDDEHFSHFGDEAGWSQAVADNYPSAVHEVDPNLSITRILDPQTGEIIGTWMGMENRGTLKPPKVTAPPRIVDPSVMGKDAMQSADNQQAPSTPNKQPEMASISWSKLTNRLTEQAPAYLAAEILRLSSQGYSIQEAYKSAREFYGNKGSAKALSFVMCEALEDSSLSNQPEGMPEEQTAQEWLNRILDNDEPMIVQRPEVDNEDVDMMVAYSQEDPNRQMTFVSTSNSSLGSDNRKGYGFGAVESIADQVRSDIDRYLNNR